MNIPFNKKNLLSAFFVLFFMSFFSNTHQAQSSKIKISAVPNWVEKITADFNDISKDNSSASGYDYILVEKQRNLEEEYFFSHYTIEILNNEGIESISDINIDFDPEYQELFFYYINIVRDGETINKLNKKEIKTVQREPNLERNLFDGRLTAIINLTDIRQGDIIDYAYGIKGRNPIHNGKYDDQIYMSFSLPVHRYHYRIIFPTKRNIQFKYINGAPNPIKKTIGDNTICVWDLKNIEPFLLDINTPSWFDPYPYVFISEYESWEDVAAQYAELYTLSEKERDELKNQLNIIIGNKDQDSIVLQSIRFVQDEIRYLGFEDGLNSHKPNKPIDVLNKRYGDCKAKSFLLSEMLRSYDIKAYPVLISTYQGRSIENNLPSPNLFDHCVVQIEKNSQVIYIDPTLSNQGGSIENIYFPNYKKGLVLKKGETFLTDLPDDEKSSTKVTERFSVGEVGKGALLYVSSTYRGGDADNQRAYFASTNIEQLKKHYVDFYSTLYPTISIKDEVIFSDKRNGKNEVVVEEFYKIDSLWFNADENDKLLYCEFYPLSLKEYVQVEKSPTRSMPYRVTYPVDYTHETIIKLPEKWSAENDDRVVESNAFNYHYNLAFDNGKNEIKMSHKYKTLVDHIKPDDVAEFISKHNEITDQFSYYLSYDKSDVVEGYKFSWFSVIVALLVVIIGIYYALKIYNNYDIPVSFPPEASLPIGGWLVIVAISLTITPFQMVYIIYSTPELFNGNIWSSYFSFDSDVRQLLLGILIIFELVYNFLFLIFSILVAVLFYKKRTILPKLAIILFASSFVFLTLDTFIAIGLNPVLYAESERQTYYREIFQAGLRAAIWIPYFILSKRVKKTFLLKSERTQEYIEV